MKGTEKSVQGAGRERRRLSGACPPGTASGGMADHLPKRVWGVPVPQTKGRKKGRTAPAFHPHGVVASPGIVKACVPFGGPLLIGPGPSSAVGLLATELPSASPESGSV